jgi:hypothetical protein
LASDAFWLASLSQFVEEELKAWKLDEASRQRILDIKSLFDCTQVAKLAKQLELLASVLFIVRTGQANGDDHQRIAQLLQANKKPFSLRDVSGGAATLRKYGISL